MIMNQHSNLTSGIGLKPAHIEQALACNDAGLWFEVHTENYFIGGGPRMDDLHRIRDRFPLSFHGVGASLGGPSLLDAAHLKSVRQLVDQFQPTMVSEHAVWSRLDAVYFAELLPLPRTSEALQRLVDGINQYQEAIGRTILIENPTNYLSLKSEMDEAAFLVEACRSTGCGLLLDVNNLFLSAHNCGIDAYSYIHDLPAELVGEIHIAGHDPDEKYGEQLLIDSHAAPVSNAVWNLLAYALDVLGPKPVLLERDANIPYFEVLQKERLTAQQLIEEKCNARITSSVG